MKKTKLILIIILIFTCSFLVLQSCGGADTGAGTNATPESGGDASEPPTTPGPTAPEVTAEPTTERPPVIREEVLRWTFSEDDRVFRTSNQISNFRVEENILKFSSTGGDPNITTINSDLGIDASEVNYIKFKILNIDGDNRAQLFFITDDDRNWDEAKSLRTDYWFADGETWEYLEFDTFDSELWEGTIRQIRFDPLHQEGDIEIEYVVFEKIVR